MESGFFFFALEDPEISREIRELKARVMEEKETGSI
jgi:hypothetical protein